MVRKSKSFQRKKMKKRSKSPKKKHLSPKRRSPSHHDGGIFTNIYNYFKPQSSKITTQNRDTTEVTEESIF
jgi:hypothetical protein